MKKMVAERREALAKGNDTNYSEIALLFAQEEEVMQEVWLKRITTKLNIADDDFDASTAYHSKGKDKVLQIMTAKNHNETECLSRAKCLELLRIQQELKLDLTDSLIKSGSVSDDPER